MTRSRASEVDQEVDDFTENAFDALMDETAPADEGGEASCFGGAGFGSSGVGGS